MLYAIGIDVEDCRKRGAIVDPPPTTSSDAST